MGSDDLDVAEQYVQLHASVYDAVAAAVTVRSLLFH